MNRFYLELINSAYMKVANGESDRAGFRVDEGEILVYKTHDIIRIDIKFNTRKD